MEKLTEGRREYGKRRRKGKKIMPENGGEGSVSEKRKKEEGNRG